jgi:hypothetical protein
MAAAILMISRRRKPMYGGVSSKLKLFFLFTTSTDESIIVSERTKYYHIGLRVSILRHGPWGLHIHPLSPLAITT